MTLANVISKCVMLPCSKVYGIITGVRNRLYDLHILPQHQFDIPVIAVGNIAVGGTGKTPHTEYIIEALRHTHHLAVLSRGYKRSTKGFILATPYSRPSDIGDEPYQMYHKFGGKVTVAVGEDRVKAIKELLRLDPDINLVVLDDAFQHRAVHPALSIVLTEYNHPLYEDHILPYGRLRESPRAINRADVVVVTKCPDNLKDLDFRLIKRNLNLFPWQKLYFSRYTYQPLVPLFPDQATSIPSIEYLTHDDAILAVAGIANPRPFVRYLKSYAPRVRVNIFDDHHNFSRKDIDLLERRFETMRGNTRLIITTEKDAVRLAANPYFPPQLRPYTFYLPVKVEFTQRTSPPFTEAILQHLQLNTASTR